MPLPAPRWLRRRGWSPGQVMRPGYVRRRGTERVVHRFKAVSHGAEYHGRAAAACQPQCNSGPGSSSSWPPEEDHEHHDVRPSHDGGPRRTGQDRRLDRAARSHRPRHGRSHRRRSAPSRARSRRGPRRQPVRGVAHGARVQPAGPRRDLRAHPGAPERAAGGRARPRSRAPHLITLLHRHRSRRTGTAHPRRRSADPPAPPPSTHHLQHHVGHHGLHGGERRDPSGPRVPSGIRATEPAAVTTRPSRQRWRRAASSCGWAACGTAAGRTGPRIAG